MAANDSFPARSPTADRVLALLTSDDLASYPSENGQLPYRIDLLQQYGYGLTWAERRRSPGGARSNFERLLDSVVVRRASQSRFSLRRTERDTNVVLAMFESEGHLRALVRSVVPRRLRRGRLVIVSCWLGELTMNASAFRRRLYRQTYRGVDLVTVFSENQRAILHHELGIADQRIAVVPFGIDFEELSPVVTSDSGTVVAVGRDHGRDWPTLLNAATGSGWRVKLATRQRQIEGLQLPREVEVLGTIHRRLYLELLAAASVVVIVTHELAYPTGQSVMLDAMALGKACVVTSTVAMSGYVEPGRTCLTVGVGDVDGLREAVDRLLADGQLRSDLGSAARVAVSRRFTAQGMWSAVAGELDRLFERR